MALALQANPVVEWYLRHQCPEVAPWLDQLGAVVVDAGDPRAVRAAELSILRKMNDWLVYVTDPAIYDAQPFLGWDSGELASLVDFTGKIVLDVGAGTGRLAFVAAPTAQVVYCVEPVENLRRYIRKKVRDIDLCNVYAVDGLITEIPFPDGFADVTMGGHVFGDEPEAERSELERVTKLGGMVILCPGNNDQDNEAHQVLMSHGYQWSRFIEPQDGRKRKYWKERR